jgi:MFS transporter, NNP family, nitrate/nitrite transporter
MHELLRSRRADELQRAVYNAEHEPEPVLSPAAGHTVLIRGDVDRVPLDELAGRVAASLIVVYPPGIAIMVPGERFAADSAAVAYLRLFEENDKLFPGFESEMQGIFPAATPTAGSVTTPTWSGSTSGVLAIAGPASRGQRLGRAGRWSLRRAGYAGRDSLADGLTAVAASRQIREMIQMGMTAGRAPEAGQTGADRRPYLMLGVAAVGFALTFWAWALLSPLGPHFKQSLHLTSFEQALVVAVPVIVGALGRIPVGALTDRYGGRLMFPVISFASILPVLFLGLAGYRSLAALLVGGFFLGVAGTSFAVGIPFVNAWFSPQRRGMATGIFGMGMGGTAISALTTVKLTAHLGIRAPFFLVAGVLAVYGVVAAVVLRDAPDRAVPSQPALSRLAATLKLRITWQASALYAVGFGGFVAFSVYLPTYLKNAYLLSQATAADKMAGFVLVAVVMRPIGGWLSDRIAPALVLAGAFAVVVAGAIGQSATPALSPGGTIAFLAMAAALGTAAGAVFALVAQRAPARQVGAVTGVVGAAGGLGGFVPPLVMGGIYGASGSYAWGLLALAVVAAGAMTYSVTTRRPAVTPQGA